MSLSFGGDADQCCKVYQMHAIVTTVTAILLCSFVLLFSVLFDTATVNMERGCTSLFMIFTHVVFFVVV